MKPGVFGAACIWFCIAAPTVADRVEETAVERAILKAVASMRGTYARHGGYVWTYSPDAALRAGEGPAGASSIWVQPPGTPTVGMAFLDAFEATGDRRCLDAAHEAARSLVRGQLHSGGWHYRIEFAPEMRLKASYRVDGGTSPPPGGPAGWETWRRRGNKGNISMLDDDTTQSALRFLLRTDAVLRGGDRELRQCLDDGLAALVGAQYPVGAWSHNFDSFPDPPPDEEHYPVLSASYPEDWPRTWPNAWEGCYHLNDNITTDAIRTLLLAHELRGGRHHLDAARRGGVFLLRARMPDPQPAWAQQYNKKMQPVWERKFEPPAVTGGESQGVIAVLLDLFEATGERRFLGPVAPALSYLERSRLPDGRLARYYELRTNKPLYCTRDYRLTHDGSDVPDHYAFTVSCRLDRLGRRYRDLTAGKSTAPPGRPGDDRVSAVLEAQAASGIWLEPGTVRDASGRKVRPREGIVSSATFAKNVSLLSAWLKGRR